MWMGKIVTTLMLLYGTKSAAEADFQDVKYFLRDFLDNEKFPTKVTAFLCNRKGDLRETMRMLSSNGFDAMVLSLPTSVSDIPYVHPEKYQFYVVDLGCEEADKILLQASQRNLFKGPFRWLIFGNPDDVESLDIHTKLDSRVYVAQNISEGFGVTAIYKYSRNSTIFSRNRIAIWSKTGGFSEYNKLDIAKNRSDLNGLELVLPYVATNPDTPNHLNDYRFRHIDPLTKVNYLLLNHLADIANFFPIWKRMSSWGYANRTTGVYSGMVGELQLGHSSLGGTPCFFTLDRLSIVDFIAATTQTYMKFIFRAPPLSYVTNVYTLPFDTYVWYSSFVIIALIFIIVLGIVFWEWKDPTFRAIVQYNQTSMKPNALDVFLMEVRAISQQGTDVEPKSNAGRLATLFTYITLLFMYVSYSANIVALLQSTTESIRTLNDLLTFRIKLGVEDIVYAHYYFENAVEPTRKTIYEQKIAPKGQPANFMPVEEGIRRMRDEFFAFHVEQTTGYKVVADIFQENEKCNLKEIEYINLVEPYLIMKKNSSYKEIFSIGMRKIHESGIQKREVNRMYLKKPVCHGKGSNFVNVGMIDCYYAFVIFAIGVFLCLIFLVLEIMAKRSSYCKCQAKQDDDNSETVD